jgi:arylsulfatase A-like enzyme
MKTKIIFLIVVLLMVFSPDAEALVPKPKAKSRPKPNILFILSDDHALEAIGAYNGRLSKYLPTPNIDRIAKEGMKFNDCFVISSICCPSRATIMTGKTSQEHGVKKVISGVIPGSDTKIPFSVMNLDCAKENIGALVQRSGYHTGVIGKWHAGFDPALGFNQYMVFPSFGTYYAPAFVENADDGAYKWTYYGEDDFSSDVITDYTINYLKDRNKDDKPFVFFVNYWAVHGEWDNHKRYDSLLVDVDLPMPDNFYDDYAGRNPSLETSWFHIGKEKVKGELVKKKDKETLHDYDKERYGVNLSEKELLYANYQSFVKKYLRCLKGMDDGIGRLLDYMEETGLDENTVIIYASDQGFFVGEHGFNDKRWGYEEAIRMPLLVKWKDRIKEGSVNSNMVLNLDFAQTFLDILGIDQPKDMQGQSFKKQLLGVKGNTRDAFYYRYYGGCGIEPHYGIRTERYKLLYFETYDFWELYNLENDSGEMHNIYNDPRYSEVVSELKAELVELKEQNGDSE